ncbi:Hypothetical Protein FCC1311_080072 [Hondaea fermentalgiana]|uniref:Uncharacterized protein n=1 Tax=Hondaea fermentalgiana TaxID=2315210 RepID=A0A2R5GLK1_9STRA|nr:Hypothetical Protein FCC1311_080072 [Hondaea fermentalgiana]|eukprot:GBG31782.1 Hypothetical Protein FCC1311_080072 [Hondaea fermentalgiana]
MMAPYADEDHMMQANPDALPTIIAKQIVLDEDIPGGTSSSLRELLDLQDADGGVYEAHAVCDATSQKKDADKDPAPAFDVSTALPEDKQLLGVIAQSMPQDDNSLDVLIQHEPPCEVFKSLAGRSWLLFTSLFILPRGVDLHYTLSRLAIDLVRGTEVVQTFVTQGWPSQSDSRLNLVEIGRQGGQRSTPIAQVQVVLGPHEVGTPACILVVMQCDRDSSISRRKNVFHAVVRLRDPERASLESFEDVIEVDAARQAADLLERADVQARAALEAPARVENCARTLEFKILSKFNHQFVKGGGERRREVIREHDKRYSDQRRWAMEHFSQTGIFEPPFVPRDLKSFVLFCEQRENGLPDDIHARRLMRLSVSPKTPRGVKRSHLAASAPASAASLGGTPKAPALSPPGLHGANSSAEALTQLRTGRSRVSPGARASGSRSAGPRRGGKQAERKRQMVLEQRVLESWESLDDHHKLSVFFRICPDLARLGTLLGTFSPLGAPMAATGGAMGGPLGGPMGPPGGMMSSLAAVMSNTNPSGAADPSSTSSASSSSNTFNNSIVQRDQHQQDHPDEPQERHQEGEQGKLDARVTMGRDQDGEAPASLKRRREADNEADNEADEDNDNDNDTEQRPSSATSQTQREGQDWAKPESRHATGSAPGSKQGEPVLEPQTGAENDL